MCKTGTKRTPSALLLTVLGLALAVAACHGDPEEGGRIPAAGDRFEPPANPFLADSPWPMSHRNPYCQASSPFPGPDGSRELEFDDRLGDLGPIFITYSSPYADGRRAIWGATFTSVFKAVETDDGPVLVGRDPSVPSLSNPISGAYTVLDREGTFFVPKGAHLRAYRDISPGVPESDFELARTFSFPAGLLSPADAIVGINLTYDGLIALATGQGVVAVVSRDFQRFATLSLGDGETVSNSIAVDEKGGIYVVTSKRMHCVVWTGSVLTLDPAAGGWSAPYETGPETPVPGRLGVGSGATPTLMGTAPGEDRFVVITDGRELMHLVLFWRDGIPRGWEPIGPGKSRRIAAEVPITFGDPTATRSTSEQSVLVRGYDAMVVSNDYNWPFTGPLALFSVVYSGHPAIQPYGVEAFTWDPGMRRLTTRWANSEVSCPNGVPTMSEATGLAYCIGARDGMWTLEGIDWETGESALTVEIRPELAFNSLYAATEVGPGGTIATGTIGGPLFLRPR